MKKSNSRLNVISKMLLFAPLLIAACSTPQERVTEAAMAGDVPALSELIASGKGNLNAAAEVESKGNRCPGYRMLTPLQAAACAGQAESVKRLIQAQVDLNHPNGTRQKSPLHFAMLKGHVHIVRLLLESGALPDSTDENGNTALMLAVSGGHAGAVRGTPRQRMRRMATTSITSAPAGPMQINPEMIDLLLKHGASVNARNRAGYTPLMSCSDAEVAGKLVGLGANVHEKNNNGETALHVAARNGNSGMVKFLLERGVEVGQPDNDGVTALTRAREKGQEESIALLAAASAKLLQRDIAAADQAARQRKPDRAMALYVVALSKASAIGGETERNLRSKVIRYVKSIGRQSHLPEQAREHLVRGSYLLKQGADLQSVEKEMRDVVQLAPWWAEGYYNLGFVQARLNKFDEASQNLRIFMAAAPSGPKAQAAQDKLYEIKFAKEENEKIMGLQGGWVDQAGSRYNVNVVGEAIIITSYNSKFTLKQNNRVIEGTVEGSAHRGNYGCTIPGQTHPVQGTIAADAKSITLEYMWTQYEASSRCVDMLGNPSNCCLLCDRVCNGVNISGTHNVSARLRRAN